MNTVVKDQCVVLVFDSDPPPLGELLQLSVELLHYFLLLVDLGHVGYLLIVFRY